MNRLIIDADVSRHIISRHIYGHFAEHLGRCIYDGFWVGEDSPIPNTRGVRRDIVDALRGIRIPNLRWPGGCFADEYHWQDGIGPRDRRPCMVNTHWGGVTENNHFGTHEFMDLCGQLACEPYICGNVGSGTVREMQQWVEYLTFDARSPMSDLRRANGREEPWRVTYWAVGNENWGCGGNMRPEYYADEYRRYATYLRNFGKNRLYKVACGFDAKWNDVLLREAGRYMDGLSIHYYTVPGEWGRKGSATDFTEAEWFTTLRKALAIEDPIRQTRGLMDYYDPARRIGLIVDEWGTWFDVEPGTNPGFLFQQNTLRDALVAAATLHIFNRHGDRIRMANIAQTVNVLQAMCLTEGPRMLVTPTCHVFEMFAVHHDATLLAADLNCDDYLCGREWIPALSACASKAADGKVHVSLCNLDPNAAKTVNVDLRGRRPGQTAGRILTAAAMNAHNTFDSPDAVRPEPFDGFTPTDGGLTVELPAKSVVVLELA